MQFVFFNEHFDVSVSYHHSSSKHIFVSRPAFLSFCWLTSNCPTNKLRDTGSVLPILLNRTLTRHVFACQKFVQHTWLDFACRFVFSCVFLFSKFSTFLLPKTCRLITFVFFEESWLSFKVKVGIYNCEKLFSFAKRRPVWIKISTCRTAHTWKSTIRGPWLDVSLFSHVRKAIRDIWLVYIGLRTKIYFAAFQCVKLSMYIIKHKIYVLAPKCDFGADATLFRGADFPRNSSISMFVPWQWLIFIILSKMVYSDYQIYLAGNIETTRHRYLQNH